MYHSKTSKSPKLKVKIKAEGKSALSLLKRLGMSPKDQQ